jgi:hypothetical protein
MAVKKRCPFCNKRLRPDGTCQTKTCPLYVPEESPADTNKQEEEEKAKAK